MTDLTASAVSVRAAHAFGDWPPSQALPLERVPVASRHRNRLTRVRATARAFGIGVADALAVAGERCPDCPYSIRVHVAVDGGWLGCPASERQAVERWGRQ